MHRSVFHTIKAILICATWILPCWGHAQLHPILESFTAIQIDDQVRLDFGIKGGSSCQGVQLERSMDGSTYEVIDLIPGVCGGSEFTEYYAVYDGSPISNQLTYYRLELGQQGRTSPLTFRYVPLFSGVNVYPNPSRSGQEIRISNPFRLGFILVVFSPSGEEILRTASQNRDTFALETSDLERGFYVLRIYEESGVDLIYTTRLIRLE